MSSESAQSQQRNLLTLKSPRPLRQQEVQLVVEVHRTADQLQVQYPLLVMASWLTNLTLLGLELYGILTLE